MSPISLPSSSSNQPPVTRRLPALRAVVAPGGPAGWRRAAPPPTGDPAPAGSVDHLHALLRRHVEQRIELNGVAQRIAIHLQTYPALDAFVDRLSPGIEEIGPRRRLP